MYSLQLASSNEKSTFKSSQNTKTAPACQQRLLESSSFSDSFDIPQVIPLARHGQTVINSTPLPLGPALPWLTRMEDEADWNLSSWGLQSCSGFNSWALTSWRSAGPSVNVLERSFRTLGGREYFAHRNEVILRCGEMASGVHFILEGTLQVLALGELEEKRQRETWATVKVGEVQEGEMVALLPWLEKRPSRFSFRVQSKGLSAIMLSGAEITTKTESYFSRFLAYEERRREEAWESSALQLLEEKQREQQELEEQLEAKIDFSGLKTRDGYVIPPECLMACHPNLRRVTPKRDPPPPVVVKSLPEIQREKRFAQMDESLRPKAEKLKEKDLDMSMLLSMDGGHQGKLKGQMFRMLTDKGQGGVFHPKTSGNANQWRKSEAYRFCQHYPVWQPELTEDDRRQGEKAEAEENAVIAERNLRVSMGRMIGVLMQVKKVIKSGVGQLRGSRIRDTDDLLSAMSPLNSEKIDRCDVADAFVDLGVASDEQVEELVAQMDMENTGQIDREELADALTSPKSSVKQIYRKLRNSIAMEMADSWFSSDGEESERTLFESSEEADDRPLMQALSPRRMSLALPEQQKLDSVAYNAMPSRPLSAPIRGKVIPRPPTPKPVGKFHAMQCRIRRRQLRKALRVHKADPKTETLETKGDPDDADDVHEKSSRWPLSQSTEPRTPMLRRRLT
eukprot:s864_g8.t1